MRVRRRTCGLCKPTKRIRRHDRKREDWLKRELSRGLDAPFLLKLRELHR